jgi:alpha-L-rhamnosidase
MKKSIPLTIVFQLCLLLVFSQPKVENLLCENLVNPIGLDVTQPRFSWQLNSNERNLMQTAYEIRLANSVTSLPKGGADSWSSGKINSDQSVQVAYAGRPLQSGNKYYWQVRVWDNKGKASAWSDVASLQIGLLQPSDWKASWIVADFKEDENMRVSPYFRKQFSATKKVKSATAYITARGLYEAYINGKRVGDFFLTPGWTNYSKRIQYQTFDVTPLLQSGNNVIGAVLGSGWYRGYIGFGGNKNFYGKQIALLFQLDIEYTDGSKQSIVSDGSWKSSKGGIRDSEIYNGETLDAREEQVGWNSLNFNDSKWGGVITTDTGKNVLLATYNEPIRKHETFKPIKIIKTPKGEQVIDFGQNLVGWVKVKVNGTAGDKITIYHAEVLDKFGNFYTENLRPAKQQDVYILKGGGAEEFEPHFTFQGFRYIKIEGYPGEIKPENFIATALYSSMKPTGSFSSSHALLNQLQHNIQWGQKGNFLDVPTDCPQRDERLGWTGDAQAFARTAAFNMGVNNFFSKWLKDVASDQLPNGSVPFVIPNVLGPGAGGSAGWADAATIIPWTMYIAYGDKRILENQYNSMKAWVGYMESNSNNWLWNKGFHFGDWLFYRPFDDNDGRSAVTDKYLIAQCFFANSTQLVINAAKVLNKPDDVTKYTANLQKIKEAFQKEYLTQSGRLVSSTQTAYVLALNFDMLPEELRKQAAERLVQNVKDYNYHLTTGFLGTPYLCHVLSRFGYTDIGYRLLMQETYPSWLYPVKMGATTIWERWDGIKPDSTFQTPGMNSFNHYAYGAIGDWMYRVVAGIDTDNETPGYKKIIIKPNVGGGLTNAKAELLSYYGTISSGWKQEGGQTTYEIEIPSNTTATIYLPASGADKISESDKPLGDQKEFKVNSSNGLVAIEVGSGKYKFTVR